ncbi:hypothetical protein N2152v2_010974 [Parachlorella kessleri]
MEYKGGVQDDSTVPPDELKAKDTCEGVWDMLSNIPPQEIHVISLSAALDHMVAISKWPGYQQTQEGLSAVEQLLARAEKQLNSMDSWGMVAFNRCAAGFKGVLQPEGLSAWQRELSQRPRLVEQLTEQGVANTLLSLGTLTESDPQLARVLDVQLAGQLLQHAKFMDRAERLRQKQGLGPSRPELNYFNMYYPGNQLMGLLMERACELVQRQQLDLQGASQILGACGFLGYLPSDLALQRLLTVLGTGELTTAETSATVMGCAWLGIIPPVEVIVACWRALMRGGGEDTQATANVAWALALLDACTPRMWEILTSRLLANLDAAAQVHLFQWHQAYLLIKLQFPQGLACPPELLTRSLAAHQAGLARRTLSTHFERVLAEAVQQLAPGQQVMVEYLVSDPDGLGWLRVDVALPGLKLAVEADGPYHFLRNVEPAQQDGLTKARDRLLRGWGWFVVVVPSSVSTRLFAADASHEELVGGLGEYLANNTAFMQYVKSTNMMMVSG